MEKDFETILHNYRRYVEEYAWSSYTLSSLGSLEPVLKHIKRNFKISRIIDLGCGYGVITRIIADYLGARDAFGVDKDTERIEIAKELGVTVVNADLTETEWSKELANFDLVTSFGVIEYLSIWDSFIENVKKN